MYNCNIVSVISNFFWNMITDCISLIIVLNNTNMHLGHNHLSTSLMAEPHKTINGVSSFGRGPNIIFSWRNCSSIALRKYSIKIQNLPLCLDRDLSTFNEVNDCTLALCSPGKTLVFNVGIQTTGNTKRKPQETFTIWLSKFVDRNYLIILRHS